jgi:hypothetical protein
MVLRDGTTYSNLAGCKIVSIPDAVMAELEAGDVLAGDFEQHGTTLHTFTGDESAWCTLTAEERQFVTDGMDCLEEHLRLDAANPDWDGEKWGPKHERTSNSVAGKLRAIAIAEHRSSSDGA